MGNTFISFHDKCLADWDKAIRIGEIGELSEYPSNEYQGFFGYKGITDLTPTLKEEAISGLKQLLNYVAGSEHIAQNRVIKMRNENEAVVSYERIITKEHSIDMSFLVIQVWHFKDRRWEIVREIAENI
jgi:hypothetical protein